MYNEGKRKIGSRRQGIKMRKILYWGMRTLFVLLCFVVATLLFMDYPISLASEGTKTVYSIQIARYRDVSEARTEFYRLTAALKKANLDYLRIERIGKFYSLRIGKFKDHAGAEKLLNTITSHLSSPRIMDVYFIEKRILTMYDPLKKGEQPLSEIANRKGDEHKKRDYGQVKLKTKVPELCFECHKELKKGRSDRYVHFLFKEGKCITCHNSHVSKIKGLMIDEVDAICLGCHDEIRNLVNNAILHGALRDNSCTECHFPHSGENKYLLVKEEKGLCLSCHEDLNQQFKKPFICLPFKEGECSSCHNSHASSIDDLLVSPPNTLCKKCHEPQCKVDRISIAALVQDSECTSCHSGHSSYDRGLLGPYGHKVFLDKNCEECHSPIKSGREMPAKIDGADLCFNCHKRSTLKYEYIDDDIHIKDAKNPCTVCHDHHASSQRNLTKKESRICINCHVSTERRTAAMEKALKTSKCEPVKKRQCFECHIPAHSSRPLNYRADELALCARCHASQHKITHPLGTDVKDPRNGQRMTCNSCHSMHSANADFMLTHDRKKALCIQCHVM